MHVVLRVTGSGGHRVAEALNLPSENEFKAIARGVSALYPQIRTVFEMGGENSKYILLDGSREQRWRRVRRLVQQFGWDPRLLHEQPVRCGHRLVH